METKNNNMKKTIILLMVLIFASGTMIAQDKIVDQIVAVVGSNIILKSDIEGMHINQQAQGITSEGDMKCEILENFLVDKLLIAEAEVDTLIEVTDSQVNQQMDAQLQSYIAHFGNEKAVEISVSRRFESYGEIPLAGQRARTWKYYWAIYNSCRG